MSEFNISQNDFSRGLVSEKLIGRSDLKDYRSALSVSQNLITMPSGGVTKRPGFQFVKELPYRSVGELGATLDCGIIPFTPDDTDSYVIILPTPTSGTFAPQSASPDLSRNISVILADGTFCTVTLNTAAAPYNLLGSWAWNLDPKGWRYAQSNDFIFITHNSGLVRPFYIVRTARTAFTVSLYNVNPEDAPGFIEGKTYPFDDSNTTSTTVTYTAIGTKLTSSTPIFNSLHEGSYFRLYDLSNTRYRYFMITGFTNTSEVVATTLGGISDIAASTDWSLSSWSDYYGYPTVVTMHNQSLLWAATKSRFNLSSPDVVWKSRYGNFFRMTDTKDDNSQDFVASSADAIKFRIGGLNNNFITWMASSSSLQIGTSNEEFIVNFSILEDGSKSIPEAKRQTSHGSLNIQPVGSGYSTLYVSRNGRSVRQFKYNSENGSYIANDMNTLNDDIFKRGSLGVKKLIWQESKKLLWCLDGSPFIRVLCFDEETGALAWSRTVNSMSLFIADIAIVPNKTLGEDEVFVIADLGLGSTTVLMKISNFFEAGQLSTPTDGDRPYYTDCSIRSYDATAKTVHSGFDILDGFTVSVLADGVYVGDTIPVAGDITLDVAAKEVIAGLPYETALRTLPVEAGGMFGDSVGAVKRIDEIGIRFYRSYDAKFGDRIMEDEGSLEPIEFDPSKGLFIGLKTVKFANGYSEDYDAYIVITQDSPTPLTISCITYRGVSYK